MENKEQKEKTFYSNFSSKNRRAQLTIFVILGLAILLSALVYFAVFRAGVSNSNAKQSSSNPIYKYAEQCIQNAALDSAVSFGYQQGYYSVPSASINTALYRIAYYYLDGKILIPDNIFFNGEFSKILNGKISEECSDFSSFKSSGYEVKYGNPTSNAKISDDQVAISVSYPITARNNGTSSSFSDFTYALPVRIGHALNVSRNLADRIKKDPTSLDLTFLLNQDVKISVSNYDNCSQVYVLLDNKSKSSNGEPYAFSFAAGFSGENCPSQS